MLSNRESARRSRHRKQAHVVELEERASKLEAENVAMRASLAHAAHAEAEAIKERAALYADLASLRTKVGRRLFEHSLSAGCVLYSCSIITMA